MTTPPLPSITDDILAEIDADFRACHTSHRDIIIEPDQAVALVERLREAERDAARYRWLRERGDSCQWMNIIRLDVEDFATIDQAIDTAMQEARET